MMNAAWSRLPCSMTTLSRTMSDGRHFPQLGPYADCSPRCQLSARAVGSCRVPVRAKLTEDLSRAGRTPNPTKQAGGHAHERQQCCHGKDHEPRSPIGAQYEARPSALAAGLASGPHRRAASRSGSPALLQRALIMPVSLCSASRSRYGRKRSLHSKFTSL